MLTLEDIISKKEIEEMIENSLETYRGSVEPGVGNLFGAIANTTTYQRVLCELMVSDNPDNKEITKAFASMLFYMEYVKYICDINDEDLKELLADYVVKKKQEIKDDNPELYNEV